MVEYSEQVRDANVSGANMNTIQSGAKRGVHRNDHSVIDEEINIDRTNGQPLLSETERTSDLRQPLRQILLVTRCSSTM